MTADPTICDRPSASRAARGRCNCPECRARLNERSRLGMRRWRARQYAVQGASHYCPICDTALPTNTGLLIHEWIQHPSAERTA